MADQTDYGIILRELLTTARTAAQLAHGKADAFSRGQVAAYHDLLDVAATQAQAMDVPLSDLGIDSFDPDSLLTPPRQAA